MRLTEIIPFWAMKRVDGESPWLLCAQVTLYAEVGVIIPDYYDPGKSRVSGLLGQSAAAANYYRLWYRGTEHTTGWG
jgi:hypothetical protein